MEIIDLAESFFAQPGDIREWGAEALGRGTLFITNLLCNLLGLEGSGGETSV